MAKKVTEQFVEDLKGIMRDNTKQIKFFTRDELKQVQNQIKVAKTLDGLVFSFSDPEVTLKFGVELILMALKSTDRVFGSQARNDLKTLAGIITYYNQIDDDLKDPDASRYLTFRLTIAFTYLYDEEVIQSRFIKDKLIIRVQAGALESAMLLDEIRNVTDSSMMIDGLEKAKKKKEKGD